MLPRLIALLLLGFAPPPQDAPPPEVPLEYRVKAAYLFNFAKFVDWPDDPGQGPLTICVAGRNVFGDVLADTIRGERIADRPLASRVILEPEPGCQVLFVPRGAAAAAYLRGSRGALTVGESPDFLAQGGIVNFIIDGNTVRFEIAAPTAERNGVKISSRLLRLARDPGAPR